MKAEQIEQEVEEDDHPRKDLEDILRFLDSISRDMLNEDEYFHPDIENYILSLKDNLTRASMLNHIDILPSFFRKNYKESLKIFPEWVYRMKNYFRMNVTVTSGRYRLVADGESHMHDVRLFWRGNLVDPSYVGMRSKDVAESFVKLAGRYRYRFGLFFRELKDSFSE